MGFVFLQQQQQRQQVAQPCLEHQQAGRCCFRASRPPCYTRQMQRPRLLPTLDKRRSALHHEAQWQNRCTVRCHSTGTGGVEVRGARVLVLGGTGRVGSSTAVALLEKDPNLQVQVASRSQESYSNAVKKRPQLASARFVQVDIDDIKALENVLKDVDLVIHCAGPFQRKERCLVLEAAIASKTPYLDVCDDADYSQLAKSYQAEAAAAGVPAITSSGIYPGISNLMAAHMISTARREYDSEWRLITRQQHGEDDVGRSSGSESVPQALQGQAVEPTRVRYSYYTAGSGGVGPTILETSFLLAGQEVVVFADGKKVMLDPLTEKRVVDFGRGIGLKPVWLYNLPEVFSTHSHMKVPSVSARFGTDPPFWNWAMVAVARLAPKSFLADRSKSKWLAKLAYPWVRIVDPFCGEKVGMLVEVDLADGSTAAGLYTHKLLNKSVGICVAAFARAMLAGNTQPGVWFPEEPEAVADRRGLLQDAAEGTMRFDLNRSPWELSTDPKQIGMGFYW